MSKDFATAFSKLEQKLSGLTLAAPSAAKPSGDSAAAPPKKEEAKKPAKEEDDIDLFGSDDDEV